MFGCFGYNGVYGWVGLVLNLLVFLIVVWLIVWIVRRFVDASAWSSSGNRVSALDIAQARYARGEISREEYLNLRETLRS